MDCITLGCRIRYHRVRKHLTQEQLAGRTAASASFMSHIERGTRVASLETLMKLCSALEVTLNALLAPPAQPTANLSVAITLVPDALLRDIALLLSKYEKP